MGRRKKQASPPWRIAVELHTSPGIFWFQHTRVLWTKALLNIVVSTHICVFTYRYCLVRVRVHICQTKQNPYDFVCVRCGEMMIKMESQWDYLQDENAIRAHLLLKRLEKPWKKTQTPLVDFLFLHNKRPIDVEWRCGKGQWLTKIPTDMVPATAKGLRLWW